MYPTTQHCAFNSLELGAHLTKRYKLNLLSTWPDWCRVWSRAQGRLQVVFALGNASHYVCGLNHTVGWSVFLLVEAAKQAFRITYMGTVFLQLSRFPIAKMVSWDNSSVPDLFFPGLPLNWADSIWMHANCRRNPAVLCGFFCLRVPLLNAKGNVWRKHRSHLINATFTSIWWLCVFIFSL